MDVLVSYDIANTAGSGARRLKAVHDICTSYGHRVQYSVFECRLSPARLERLTTDLLAVIDPTADSVLIYRFAGRLSEQRTVLGRRRTRELGQPWII